MTIAARAATIARVNALRGAVIGAIVGAIVAAIARVAVGTWTLGADERVRAYAAAAIAGVLVGLASGEPVWSARARGVVAAKSIAGGVLGAGALHALRHWVSAQGGAYMPLALAVVGFVVGAMYGAERGRGRD